MTSRLELAVRYAHEGMLWGASLFVPTLRRREWLEEWQGELWYVLRECSPKTRVHPRSMKEATAFCLGAYRDAIWIRKRSWQKQQLLSRICGSPAFCLLLLIGIFLAAWGFARSSPRVAAGMSRIEVYPWLLSEQHEVPCDCPSDAIAEGKSLQSMRQYFDGFSHYSITRQTVSSSTMPRAEWTIAHSNSDFFTVLQLPVRRMLPATERPNNLPQIVLSEETWRRDFGAKTNIGGTRLHVGSVDYTLVGVALGASMGLSGEANAWLLGPDSHVENSSQEFVVWHLTPAGYFQMGPRWVLSLFGIALAFLVVPCITHLSMGDYDSGHCKTSLCRRSLIWGFFIAKMALVLGIAYFASIDLSCSFVQPLSHLAGLLQGASSFTLCLFGVSWAFRDQQRRCPVCLSRMAHPVEVGQLSRTFLEWNGTELVCASGHTLLHIPETPTSWFGAQRWLYLDRSWQFLFARPSGS
jgi:hypothetical protein